MINNEITKKKVFVETYGCQMNEYDTELVKTILTKEGYSFVEDELRADVIMLNTCAIRENAHRKVYGRIHEIRHKRKSAAVGRFLPAGQNLPLIGVLGCMATNLRTELFENRNLKIDFIAGPDSYKRLPQLITEAQATGEKQFDLTLCEYETYSDIFPTQALDGNPSASSLDNLGPSSNVNPSTPPTASLGEAKRSGSLRVNAWIAVMRGCNNFCTFCVVPYTRGRERSRSVDNVVEEVHRLADEGFKQVTLLGQNVNSYRYEDADFADLIEAVSKVDGIKRIRFTSPHPKDFPDKLLDVIAKNPKACKHIHLPLQSGNDRILELMNRTYTQKEFLQLVDKIRYKIPHIVLTTDIIVGFCSEKEEEFEDTIEVMQKVEFDSAFTFKYSERKQTIASKKYKDDISDEIKTERIVRLVDLQRQISLKKNKAHTGEVHQVLIEGRSPRSSERLQGRTDGNKIVVFPSKNRYPGNLIFVRITDASANILKGEVELTK